jgi:hypothetical protein
MTNEDPLDYIDFADVIAHGDPGNWKYMGPKAGSPTPAASPNSSPGRNITTSMRMNSELKSKFITSGIPTEQWTM